jgi:asparagine synthase (glutamine-hydrolysing)
MCGIFGKIYFHRKKNESKMLVNCLNTLAHRGPDDSGIYEDNNAFLGSTRLSIIDLSTAGHMPMYNKKKNLWIVFNGEVFNYLEIRKTLEKKYIFSSNTDTEVVLHLFEEKGPACLNELRGMFSFAIWDARKKELFLARDHLGKKPLKYYIDSDSFIFSSELKAILKDPSIPREIDPIAIDEFLTYQYVPSPRTGFKNIFKLEPAHYLIVKKDGEVVKKRYWQPQFLPKLTVSEQELKEMVLCELKNSVKMRLRSDVPLGAHLSGGVDSSLIVALMSEQLNHPVKTFSVGFKETQYNELPYAKLVSNRYKTNHHEIMVDLDSMKELNQIIYSFEEPYADPSMIPTWLLCKETKKEVTVALNGDGGDESFGGYQRYKRYKIIQYLRNLPFKKDLKNLSQLIPGEIGRKVDRLLSETLLENQQVYPKLFGGFGEEEKNKYYTSEFKHEVSKHNPYLYLDKYISNTHLKGVDVLLNADLQTYLPEDLLAKVDIAGMAHSLEVRSPLLDHTFVEFVARIPNGLKLHGWTSKHLLKEIAKAYLPQEHITRKKQGFGVPLEYWFNSEILKKQFRELFEGKTLLSNYIKGEMVSSMLKKISNSDLPLEKQDVSNLWLIVCLKAWLDVWFI